ncbi:hypothetical protein TWF481_009173 [Arthrobotrys musiformis]|uniref:RGS domain-containing protein n=1 Tax=Arthrobotrys musiformis TaxID=47236 RepID=A0AAV9W8P7_9PEZI
MLDLFYRRPTTTCSSGTFGSTPTCENGICPEIDGIPPKLSFDRVVNGHTSADYRDSAQKELELTKLKPCTLEDFSKYLRFSNMNDHADALQFFVWRREVALAALGKHDTTNELRAKVTSLAPVTVFR